jgi:hypothetical protein
MMVAVALFAVAMSACLEGVRLMRLRRTYQQYAGL